MAGRRRRERLAGLSDSALMLALAFKAAALLGLADMLELGSIWSCACACCPPALDSLVLVTRLSLTRSVGF